MTCQVFISYSSRNKNDRILLENYLKSNGVVTMWIDEEEIRPGEIISERIKDGVLKGSCCVLLLSQYSADSAWCMAEVGAFLGANKRIISYPIEPRCAKIPAILEGIRFANNPEEVVKSCREVREPDDPPLSPNEYYIKSLRLSRLTNAFKIPVDDHRREDAVERLVADERSRSEQRKFRLLASSGYNYLHPNGKVWRAGLGDAITNSEAEFSIILESPFSDFAVTRALANNVENSITCQCASQSIR
jgi:hypothetical protein